MNSLWKLFLVSLVQIQVRNQPTKDYVGTRVDGTRFTYKSSDGTVMNGWVNDKNSISVSSSSSDWSAEWNRR